MALSSESLTPVADYLEEHEEFQRIQKLVFCLCKKYWENDPNVLQSFSLNQLLLELVQAKPTIEQLTFSMYKLVKTLNRPKVYAGVAKVILDQLGPVYHSEKKRESDEDNRTKMTVVERSLSDKETQVIDQDFLAEQIANKLSQHSESSRMVKLVYAACKDSWENDAEVIHRYGLKNLITELREKYPRKEEIQFVFNRLVANINKQTLYLAIANLILSQMDCLYDHFDEGEENPHSQSLKTQILQTPDVLALTRANRRQDIETSIIEVNAEPIETVLSSNSQPQKSPSANAPKAYNLFELRLEIMQYTNPLRTKILLFSVLFHTWDKQGKDWAMLRGYSLDDLMQQVILTGKPIAEIEAKLFAEAKTFTETEAYVQTAGTIIQALKSVF
jgi:hypothetical protein